MQAHAKVCLVSFALLTLSGCAGEAVDDARKPLPRPMASGGYGGYTPYSYAGSAPFGKAGASPGLAGNGGSGGQAGSSGAPGGAGGVAGGAIGNAGASGSGTARGGSGGSGGSTALGTAGANSAGNCPSPQFVRLPDGKCVTRVTEFEVARKPKSIVTDSNGQIWVDDDEANQIIQLDKDGHVTRRVDCATGSSPRSLVGGAGDVLFWYTDAHAKQLIKVTKSSDKASVTNLGFSASALARSANNELFAAEFGKALYHVIPDQDSPTRWAAAPTDALLVSPDNNVWSSDGSALTQLSPTGVKSFQLPETSYANGLCVGPNKELWFTDNFADQLVQVTLDGRIQSPINLPSTTAPGRIITGPDKALWFVEGGALMIGRFDIKTGQFTHYSLPTSGATPYALTVGPDNAIWFTETTRMVGRLIPDPIVQ